MQKSKIQIVWFKRDLRATDHKPLFEASQTLKPILPIYVVENEYWNCLLYTSPSPRDRTRSRMPSSA